MRRSDRGEALLNVATAQLNDLPSYVDTELRPPAVILDSTKSTDGQDVLAICSTNPNVPGGLANIIHVPAANSRFRGVGVGPGDVVKYYVLEDETVDEESRLAGFTRRLAMDLVVAQVLDDNTLLIEGGLNTIVPIPQKIEIWRYRDDRLVEINRQLRLYRDRRLPPLDWKPSGDRRLPPLGWEPSPDDKVLTQIVVWLNQWLRQSQPITDWRIDPLLETLGAKLRADEALAPFISNEALADSPFELHEGRLLQEAVWLRDISRWARGDSFDNVERAAALFDWTVRNVQLEADENGVAHRPWQVLLYGRGTAEQRAWVFALLCRQAGLDVVMLATAPNVEDAETAAPADDATFWLPALADGEKLYLFDTQLGLAIPGPQGDGVATLKQVREDGSLLRQLDVEGAPYRVSAEALERVTACVVADPFELSRRFRQVEERLTGDDRLALTVDASAVAERLKSSAQIGDVRLWAMSFETLRDQLTLGKSARFNAVLAFEPFATRPLLWKARTRHFQGRRHGGDEQQGGETSEIIDDHGEAARLYTSKSVRPTDRDIARETSDDKRRVDTAAKINATYWVGLLSFDDGKYDVAAHWLGRPELLAAGSPWSAGARYNLARTCEAQGKLEEAIAVLEEDSSPQRHGNQLRARRLRSRIEAAEQSGN